MLGTTWKKKSRHGLPEDKYVAELFSVKPITGWLNPVFSALMKSMETNALCDLDVDSTRKSLRLNVDLRSEVDLDDML